MISDRDRWMLNAGMGFLLLAVILGAVVLFSGSLRNMLSGCG